MAGSEERHQDHHGKDNQDQDGSVVDVSGFFDDGSSQYLQTARNNGGPAVASGFGRHQDDGILNSNNGGDGFFNGDSSHNHLLGRSSNNGGSAGFYDIVGLLLEGNFYDNGAADRTTGLFNGESCQYNLGRSNNNGGVVDVALNQQGINTSGLGIERSISEAKRLKITSTQEAQQHRPPIKQPAPEKFKASSSHAVLLNIGSWSWKSINLGDLVAKIYYAKKKLVWEFLFGSLKKKMEIRWSQISAINVFTNEDKTNRLEIELNEQPEYHEEINFRAKKHTQWTATNDFTNGQATINRRHTIIFLPGVLDTPLKNLFACDKRIFNLSQQPFPTHNSPLFGNPIPLDLSYNPPVSNNHQIQQTSYNPIVTRPSFSDIYQDMELNPLDSQELLELTNNQYTFNVDSTCNPFEQNHQMTCNNGGNEMYNQELVDNSWLHIPVGIDNSNIIGGFYGSGSNGGHGFQEPLLLPEVNNNMNDFNNDGVMMNRMGYMNNGVRSFEGSGLNGGFAEASTNGQHEYLLPWEPRMGNCGNQAYNPDRR